MKTIGLLSSIDLPSTIHYIKGFDFCKKELDLDNSPKVVARCGDYENINRLRKENRWDDIATEAVEDAIALKSAGASFLVIATSIMHKVADKVEKYATIPVLHIATPTVAALKENGYNKALLLGTKWLMEESFLINKLQNDGINITVPDLKHRDDLEKIRIERDYARYPNFVGIACKYDAQVSLVACSKFNPIFNSDLWFVKRQDDGCGNNTVFLDMAGLHIRAAVKMATGKSC